MRAWKKVTTMILAVVMAILTPMSVLAESVVLPVTESEAAVVKDMAQEELVEETENEEKLLDDVPVPEEMADSIDLEEKTKEEVQSGNELEVLDKSKILDESEALNEQEVKDDVPVMPPVVEEINEHSVEQIRTGTLVSTENATITASYSMFKVAESAKVNTYSDGSMEAVIIYAGSSFLKMYLGTAEEAGAATKGIYEAVQLGEKEYRYTIPVKALDTAFNAAVLSSKGSWKDNTLTVSLVKEPEQPTLVSTQDANVTASYSMFKVAESAKVNTYSDGSMEAEIIYTGSSFLKMYLGTAEEAGAATEGIYEAVQLGEKEYRYIIPVKELGTEFQAAVLSSKGSWKDNTLTVVLKEEISDVPDPDVPEETNIPEDGKYMIHVTSSAAMFKVVDCILTVKDKAMTAVITLSGTGYDYLYMGTGEDAAKASSEDWIPYAENAEGKYTFEIPVESLDKEIAVAAHSLKNDKWYDRTLTFDAGTLQEYVNIPEEGKYTIEVTSSAAMFKVVACMLTVKDKVMTAVITLSGTGYDYLYMGTGEDAEKASSENWIPYVEDAEGKYTFEILVESLDKEIAVVAHSLKNDKWYDRVLVFDSVTLKSLSDDTKPEENTPENDKPQIPEQGNTGVTDDEDIKDMIENTIKGEVKDGTYKPSFGYKGGTGRVALSCNKVVVKDGKATATIVFDSSSYTYMRVNGTKYFNANKGGNSTFVIPVTLNGATTVYAETTAMSEAHEIEYVLYVYVDGTNVSNIKPVVTASKDDVKEEKAEEETVETTSKEENTWGAFGSEQKQEAKELAANNNEEVIDETPSTLLVVGIIAAAAVAVAGLAAAVVFKKKLNMK